MTEYPDPSRDGRGRYTRSPGTVSRDGQALELRITGATFDEIADRLGMCDRSAASKAVRRALADTMREPAEELRTLELERLDAVERRAWEVLNTEYPLVSHGRVIEAGGRTVADYRPVLAALDRILKAAERRARLLGLDTPVRADVTVQQVDMRDSELVNMIEEAKERVTAEENALRGDGSDRDGAEAGE